MRNPIAVPVDAANAASRALVRSRAGRISVLGRSRQRPHYLRKFYHMLMGMMCFSIYGFMTDRNGALALLVGVGGLLVLLDLARFCFPGLNNFALKLCGSMMRREELHQVSANSFYVLGLLVITALFPQPIVLLSVLFLALGDPIAALVGTRWGRRKWLNSRKSIEGSLANAFTCSLATALFVGGYLHITDGRLFSLALCGGIVGLVAELLPLPIDDNFTIPVASATLLSVVNGFIPFV